MKIYTQNEAKEIVELFEDILDRYDITVPSPEDDERTEDNCARLYGSVWSELLDEVQERLVELTEDIQNGADVVAYAWED